MTATVPVMIVDDHAPFRSVAGSLVRSLPGWRVVAEAETGEQAREQALTDRPAVILMDVNLPGISGIEAARQIHAVAPEITIILVSTYDADDLPATDRDALPYVRKDQLTPARIRALHDHGPNPDLVTGQGPTRP